ncbi:MAG: 50S ribosomal protein L11 methyltransferase [Ruminococcaceae bacterium]|nr:50S ribosomal protein L11 methyltransferase [Oscillospiraceae bacterium]
MGTSWIQAVIYTTAAGIEPVSGRLYQLGITGLEIEDETDFKTFLEENKNAWDYVDDELMEAKSGETNIKIYVTDNAAGHETLGEVERTLKELAAYDQEQAFGSLRMELSGMDEEDWANNWKQYFKPLAIGEKILVLPEWETLDEPTDRTIFTINPGMSFGTGSHHTTKLCLERLEKYIKPGMEVLDLGCGSGILSAVALLLGAKSATAVDIDPNAAEIARKNARRNGIEDERYRVFAGNVLTDDKLLQAISDRTYDLVLANIVADVIIALAPKIPPLLASGGTYITSGIITERGDEVKAACNEVGMRLQTESQSGDWLALDYQKN